MATHQPFLAPLSPEQPDPQWERLDEPAFLRHPRALRVLESDELEEDQVAPGVSEVHWAPLPTRWTDQPPARTGVYQCRPPGAGGYAFVQVYQAADGTLAWKPYPLRMSHGGPVPPAPHHDQVAALEWSDRPIPQPLEAT